MSKVGIVTPLYNHRKYLPRTVEAVLNQTFQDWRWYVTDDSSTDGSYEFMQEVAAQEPRITLMRNEVNSKIVKTTQRSMDAAKDAEFWYILDSDDYCVPHYLETLLGLLDKHPTASCAFARCYTMDASNGYWGAWPRKPDFFRPGLQEFRNQLLSYSMKGTTTLYRMSMCASIGGWASHPLTRMHDKYYDLRALLEGDVVYTDEPLGHYRVHTTNHSSNRTEQIIPEVAEEVFGMVEDLMDRVPENPYYSIEELRVEANLQYAMYISHLINVAQELNEPEKASQLQELLDRRGIERPAPMAGSKWEQRIDFVRPLIKKLTYRKLPPLNLPIKLDSVEAA